MQTLLRFWHWHRNEKPSVELTRRKRDQLLSPLAKQALFLAVEQVGRRARCGPDEWGPHWEALEKLSVKFAEGLTELDAALPAPDPGKPYALPTHFSREQYELAARLKPERVREMARILDEHERVAREIEQAERRAPVPWYVHASSPIQTTFTAEDNYALRPTSYLTTFRSPQAV